MEKSESGDFVHSNLGKGNSFHQVINSDYYYDTYKELVIPAIEALNCSISTEAPFVIAEYGAFDGRDLVKKLPLLKEHILSKYGKERNISILLEDICYEAMKTIWEERPECDKVTYLVSGSSFYKQCMPPNTVHFGQVCLATHWFDYGNIKVKNSLFPNLASDIYLKQEIDRIARKDWELFLCHRAKELARGGVLLCVNLGYSPGIYELMRWHPLNAAWKKLCLQGFITQDEKEAGVVQDIIRTKEQHLEPFVDQQSSVYKAGLRLVQFQSYSFNCFNYIQGKADDVKDLQMLLAEKYTGFYKCIYYRQLLKALDENRSKNECAGIMETYFNLVKTEFLGMKSLEEFKPDCCLHFLVIRKE